MDGLCSNLSVLGLSVGALVSVPEPEDPAEHDASAASHRSALKAYAFFLSWLTALAEEEAQMAMPDQSAGTAGHISEHCQCSSRPCPRPLGYPANHGQLTCPACCPIASLGRITPSLKTVQPAAGEPDVSCCKASPVAGHQGGVRQ